MGVRERAGLHPGDQDRANRNAFTQHGHGDRASITASPGHLAGPLRTSIYRDIRYDDDRALEDCPPRASILARRSGIESTPGVFAARSEVHHCAQVHQLTVVPEDTTHQAATQPCRTLGDRIKRGLQVELRAADDAQHLAGRRLVLEGLLQFLKQTHVLDGNHRLVGEGGDEFDLLFGKWINGRARQKQGADRSSLPH